MEKKKATSKRTSAGRKSNTSTRKAQTAATAPKKSSGTKSRSGGTRKPAGEKGQQQQDMGAGPQGAGTMMGQPAPMFGGTKQVAIEEVTMSNRGGRKQGPEPYPFGELPPSRIENGVITGPSFFIPDSEQPKKIIAAGRKRHKHAGKVFLTRQMEGPAPGNPDQKVSGVRVWLEPAKK